LLYLFLILKVHPIHLISLFQVLILFFQNLQVDFMQTSSFTNEFYVYLAKTFSF